MEFPCWMYHRDHGARLFGYEEEFHLAGFGWTDHPGDVDKAYADAQRERDMAIAGSVRKSAKAK